MVRALDLPGNEECACALVHHINELSLPARQAVPRTSERGTAGLTTSSSRIGSSEKYAIQRHIPFHSSYVAHIENGRNEARVRAS